MQCLNKKNFLNLGPENNVNIYYHLANIREKLNKLDEAKRDYLKAIEIDPNYAQSYHGLGLLMDKLNNYDTAIEYFSKSIELDESNAIFWHNRGCTYRNLGKLDLALNDINHQSPIFYFF